MILPPSIHILSVIDKNYLQHFGVLMTSLYENKICPNKVIYHIIHSDLEPGDRKLVNGIAARYESEILFHAINDNDRFNAIRRYGHISKTAFYRLLAGEILPPTIEKILYLDCDMVVNGDLAALWETSMGDSIIAAVEDAPKFTRHEQLFMPKGSRYFNSGVLLIDLVKWRKENITGQIIEFLTNYPERRKFNDQDGLNAILYNKWFRLPPVFNQQSVIYYLPARRLRYSVKEYYDALHTPIIIHFTGVLSNLKPWHYGNIHPKKDLYYKYLTLTPWAGYKPGNKNLTEIIKKIYYQLLRIKMKSGFVIFNKKSN